MSDLLQTIENQVAKENGFEDWTHAEAELLTYNLWPEVCKRYAFEVAKASLKEASEKGKGRLLVDGEIATMTGVKAVIDKSTILDESNIKF